MKIEKDIKRIKELAAKKEDENWRFRSFLKGVDLSVGELDAIVHRHNDEVSRQIDCGACGNCCKTILPTLSSDDINRLARELDTSTEDFISRYLIPTEHGDEHTFNGTPCPLLSGKKCTVHAARPDACRSYPHLQKEDFVFRLIQAVDNCSICPIVYNVFERLKDELWDSQPGFWMHDDTP